jgi:hypothetical protein
MSLVVKKWYADARPNENGLYVEILARKPGVVAWLFTLIGIDDTHYLGVFFDKIIIQKSSLEGFKKTIVPIDSVSFTYFGFKKPWKKALILFFALVILSVFLASTGILVGSVIVAGIYYFLNQQLVIGISEQSGKNLGLNSLKRSLIEGEGVTVERLDLATKIIATLIDQHKVRDSGNFSQENQNS